MTTSSTPTKSAVFRGALECIGKLKPCWCRRSTSTAMPAIAAVASAERPGAGQATGRSPDSHARRADPPVRQCADGATLDLHLATASVKSVKLRNIAAVLRGADPVLKNTYVVLSPHYDHLGIRPDMPGDNTFNSANDEGSGTGSVIEVASTLAAMKQRPKRSILFLNVFGEEPGVRGSDYFGRHPLVPVADTVANLNLEQIGRTDGPLTACRVNIGLAIVNFFFVNPRFLFFLLTFLRRLLDWLGYRPGCRCSCPLVQVVHNMLVRSRCRTAMPSA